MRLAEKIEEIKRKPEHIRVRYAYFSAAMFFPLILAIWIFSMKANDAASDPESAGSVERIKDAASQFGQEKEKIEGMIMDGQKKIEEQVQTEGEGVQKTESVDVSKDIQAVPEKTDLSEDKMPSQSGVPAPDLFPSDSGI